ncbi:hypothetical protein KFK09_018151 [Dendrobium nobile]|uniref:glutathione transferase n=1 Tax=Dendrobium nobile TaxID=94219 RepID=A0A8T3AU18_DENNO|nr:hypothetical protein KFK09_018151 [Dendrobium nobile]
MAAEDVKLIGTWESPLVARARIALNLKEIEYEFLEEDPNKKSELLLKSNPVYKRFPVLIHGSKPICHSLLIIEYIDQVWPSSGFPILPADAYDRVTSRFWATYIDDTNVPLVYKLLSCWDSKKQCFLIKDQKLLFTADEVAMILGLPNRGNNFEIGSARITVYNDADASSLFDGLEVGHLLTSFDAITTEERALLANPPPQTLQTSPDKVPNKEIILHTPHEHLSTPPTPPTPKSPLRQNTPPPSPVRLPPSPISPGGPSTETPHVSHSQQQQQQHTPPPEGQQDYRGEYIQKVLDQNRFLKGRLITLETTMALNERRMEAVEHYVFEQREMNKRMEAMEKFLSENFPSFNSSTAAVHVQSSSRTMSDEMKKAECAEVIAECMFEDTQPLKDVLAKPEPSSSGIAKRVRGRVDRKAKEVKTPYTKGQYKRKVLKKAAVRPSPAKVELINALIEVESQRSPGPRPAPTKLDYPGRQMISDDMRMFIDACLEKYTDMSDTIYTAGNIQIFRSQIDELLTNQYLDDNHIDAFASLLAEKNKLRPGLYQPFIYVSSLHWINHLQEETQGCFQTDIRTWKILEAEGVPTQTNGYDCGMFVCKYMENVIQTNSVKWDLLMNWQAEMPKFRAELAFMMLCSTLKR